MAFRLDRAATLYLANPLQRFSAAARHGIPILMYHSICGDEEAALHPYYRTATSPRVFAEQMGFLRGNGYNTLSLAEARSQLEAGLTTAKSVVITFDDGFRDFYSEAFPTLKQCAFTATVFLPTSFIGDSRLQFKAKDCLTWEEVRELDRGGVTFGSHTVSHPQLRNLTWKQIEEEVTVSKQTIEQETGKPVHSFAYPYAFPETNGEFKKRMREALIRAGYENGVCTTIGTAGRESDTFFMKRLPMNSADDVRLFEAKLAGGYDWLAKPQYLVKAAKSWGRAERS